MSDQGKAERIDWLDLKTPPMRAFHMAWLAFFLSFFAWFALAPLMPILVEEFRMSDAQVQGLLIAAVATTGFARIGVGRLCDRFGPRRTFGWLLILGGIPVIGCGLAQSYTALFSFRLAISAIGATFVVTQVHTSLMFAPGCVGRANAFSAGLGNSGGGATHLLMPLLIAGMTGVGISAFWSWRIAMVIVGSICALVGVAYLHLTQDTPEGPFRVQTKKEDAARVTRDPRTWVLFLCYAACFGTLVHFYNLSALYLVKHFSLTPGWAGLLAGMFGLMAIVARPLGGALGDRFGKNGGLPGRVRWLSISLVGQGLCLILFAGIESISLAVPGIMLFGLFVHMSTGATYAVVPFVQPRSVGSISGIVGSGGSFGALFAALLFRFGGLSEQAGLILLGLFALACGLLTSQVRFVREEQSTLELGRS